MFNLLKRKPPPPLEEATRLIYNAIEIAYKYKRDKHYVPTEADLVVFDALSQLLWEQHTTAQYIARSMRQRYDGEPEGAKKWHDDKVFDWHYPP